MRILAVSNLYPPDSLGGHELLCSQVCGALAAAGHGVRVLTSAQGQVAGVQEQAGVTVHRGLQLAAPFDRLGGLGYVGQQGLWRRNGRTTARAIEDWAPEVVFLWSQLHLTTGPAATAEASGVPVAYTFNDASIRGMQPAASGRSPRVLVRHLWDTCLAPHLTTRRLQLRHVTCISEQLKRTLVAGGLPLANAKVIYQGVPLGQFPPKADPGCPGVPLRLLYSGQLHDDKGVHTLIEAAHRVASRRGAGSLAVTIVGAGSALYTGRLVSMAKAGPAAVVFAGKQPHAAMPAIYRDHHVLAVPAVWQEPIGLTHLEAMASGTTVVSTVHEGQGEFLVPGVNALAVAAGDAVGLACQLGRLLDDPRLSRRLAQVGRRTVVEGFSLERYAAELAAFLATAIDAAAMDARDPWESLAAAVRSVAAG